MQKLKNIAKETQGVIENLLAYGVIAGLVTLSIHKGLFTLTPNQLVAIGSIGLGFMVFRHLLNRR